MLAQCALFVFGARDAGGRVVAFLIGRQERAFLAEQQPIFGAIRDGSGAIGQDHHRRFEALGAVHRHHPHRVARGFHLAFDLARIGFDLVQESCRLGAA